MPSATEDFSRFAVGPIYVAWEDYLPAFGGSGTGAVVVDPVSGSKVFGPLYQPGNLRAIFFSDAAGGPEVVWPSGEIRADFRCMPMTTQPGEYLTGAPIFTMYYSTPTEQFDSSALWWPDYYSNAELFFYESNYTSPTSSNFSLGAHFNDWHTASFAWNGGDYTMTVSRGGTVVWTVTGTNPYPYNSGVRFGANLYVVGANAIIGRYDGILDNLYVNIPDPVVGAWTVG